MSQLPRWADVPEVAEHYGVSVRTVRRLLSEGRITGHKFGSRLVRIDLNEVDAAMLGADESRAALIEEHAKRVADEIGPLSDEQIDRIAGLLRGAK